MTSDTQRLREALKRISALTPAAANAATARDLHMTVRAIADAALADTPPKVGSGELDAAGVAVTDALYEASVIERANEILEEVRLKGGYKMVARGTAVLSIPAKESGR